MIQIKKTVLAIRMRIELSTQYEITDIIIRVELDVHDFLHVCWFIFLFSSIQHDETRPNGFNCHRCSCCTVLTGYRPLRAQGTPPSPAPSRHPRHTIHQEYIFYIENTTR